MSLSTLSRSLLAVAALGTAFSAMADPTCTKEPESNWMSMDDAKAQVEAMGYKIKVFKKTDTGCYELYGHTSDGKRAEIYFDPTNMTKVKEEIDD